MLTKKALFTKWALYALALLLFLFLQQAVLDQLRILNVYPFLLPMVIAVVAALEGPTGGTVFGIAVGFLCDNAGAGVFPGVYTFSFFCIALAVAIISKYWVMRNVFGSLIYALIAYAIIDLIQFLFLLAVHHANPLAVLELAGREIAASIVFVIPIFFLYTRLNRLFRYDS